MQLLYWKMKNIAKKVVVTDQLLYFGTWSENFWVRAILGITGTLLAVMRPCNGMMMSYPLDLFYSTFTPTCSVIFFSFFFVLDNEVLYGR